MFTFLILEDHIQNWNFISEKWKKEMIWVANTNENLFLFSFSFFFLFLIQHSTRQMFHIYPFFCLPFLLLQWVRSIWLYSLDYLSSLRWHTMCVFDRLSARNIIWMTLFLFPMCMFHANRIRKWTFRGVFGCVRWKNSVKRMGTLSWRAWRKRYVN